ncbi:LysR substrate binding domain-containing protein [Caballeronia arationis]|uniref:LysR substrate binding domain-containing protein n=1 Tax=Caballeronia arationis TaxID=1777142 RepID=A0A7Z7I7A0_9BURK|nr:LysR substrate binding domain-containing protein [Caballeronia arationis]
MELRHLRYFVAVADERNFTRAAQRLHIAQPPLSRQIQQLEETLGVQLFERNSRPLKLTETGKFFYSHAVQLLAQTAELESMTRRVGNIERSLSVGFVGSTLYGMLPKIIRRFRDENTTVELSLHEMSTMDQIRALKDGRIDVGFGRIRLEDANIRRVILREEKMIVALPVGHPLSLIKPVLALRDLVNETLIIFPKTPRPSYADQVLAAFPHGDFLGASALLDERRRPSTDRTCHAILDAHRCAGPDIRTQCGRGIGWTREVLMTDAAPVFSSANRLSTTCPTVRATRRGVRLQSPYGLPSTHPASTPLQSYPGIPKANSTASYLRLCLCNADVNLTPPDLCGSPAPSTLGNLQCKHVRACVAHEFKRVLRTRHGFVGHDGHDETRCKSRKCSALLARRRLLDEIDAGSFQRFDSERCVDLVPGLIHASRTLLLARLTCSHL